jgi:hypothetical protein
MMVCPGEGRGQSVRQQAVHGRSQARGRHDFREIAENGADPANIAPRLNALQKRKEETEARLAALGGNHVIELHPTAAESYSAIVSRLHQLVGDNEKMTDELRATLRNLITEIKIIPTPGRAPLKLEITGNLAALLSKNGNINTAKLVAGACVGRHSASVPVSFSA